MTVRNLLKQMNQIESNNFVRLVDCKKNPILPYKITPEAMLSYIPTILLEELVLGVYSSYIEQSNSIDSITREIMITLKEKDSEFH